MTGMTATLSDVARVTPLRTWRVTVPGNALTRTVQVSTMNQTGPKNMPNMTALVDNPETAVTGPWKRPTSRFWKSST